MCVKVTRGKSTCSFCLFMHSKAQVGFAGEDLSHTSKSMGQNLSEPIRGVEYLRHYIPQAEVRQIVSRT